MYEVAIHGYGRPIVKRGPAEGLPDFPKHTWTRITGRPIGKARAIALADEQECHAIVCVYQKAMKIHDNGRAPYLPDGWVPDDDPTQP